MLLNDNNRKKILLLDGTGIVYRAYFAFISRPLTTERGESTSAIFGFFRMFSQIIRDFRPYNIITAFDISRDTFRRKIYPEYKMHREEAPADLKEQIPVVINLLEKMGLPVLEMQDYEADDIIGTLSDKFKKDSSFDIYIVSGDKDLFQLVGDNVMVLRPQLGVSELNVIKREGVKETIGVYPEQVPDYLALTGDASDNIPGVKGIGSKGAASLLGTYSDLDDIYAHLDEIKGAVKNKLEEGRESAYLSRELTRIKKDLLIEGVTLENKINPAGLTSAEAFEILEYYRLTAVIADMKKIAWLMENGESQDGLFSSAVKEDDFKGNYKLITCRKEMENLLQSILKKKLISLDTETTSVSPIEGLLIGISISLEEGSGFFIPVGYPFESDLTADYIIDRMKELLENPEILKIGQNIKYEMGVFGKLGIKLRGTCFDTMIAAYLLNSVRTHNNLENLVSEYLGYKKKSYTDVLKNVLKKDKTLLDLSPSEITEYACGDSDAALRLYNKLSPMIEKSGLENVMYNIELPLISVLSGMEMFGVKIDISRLKILSLELEKSMVEIENNIYRLAGRHININSPAQLSVLLFDEIGLEPVKKTEGGKFSTDEEVLSELANVHPLPAEILKYRTYSKLKNTYIDSLPQMILPQTGRIHTSFNQTITATGRLSSSDPNLQNIPVRDEIGRKIREAFVAGEGKVLVSADYSQIELRVLAHFCGDANMKQAFLDKKDIHRHTASLIFGVNENNVSDDMRRKAKGVNFGIIYGLQAFGLSKQTAMTISEARLFINSYFQSFPKVKEFVHSTLIEAAETGEIRTLSGRFRKFAELKGHEVKWPGQMNASQRMALNTKIQGSAADIIKIAMISLDKNITDNFRDCRLIMQIHDELVVEAPADKAEAVKVSMISIMESAFKMDVPLAVEAGIGTNWSLAH